MKSFRTGKRVCVIISLVGAIMLSAFLTGKYLVASEGLADCNQNAADWLVGQVDSEGIWEEDNLPNQTCNSMMVLKKIGISVSDKYIEQWDNEHQEKNVDELSHVILALQKSEKLPELFEMQNDDGGFGLNSEFQSENYDTLLALQALEVSKDIEEKAQRAAEYLMKQQNVDGGLGMIPGEESDAKLSAECGIALVSLNIKSEDFFQKLDQYCLQIYKGNFSKDSFCEQAVLARYLLMRNQISEVQTLKDKLLKMQQTDGSVYHDVKATQEYILLNCELEEYLKLKVKIHQMKSETDTYILESGKENSIYTETTIDYTSNQDVKGIVYYHIMEDGVEIDQRTKEIRFTANENENVICDEFVVNPTYGKHYSLFCECYIGEGQEKNVCGKSNEIEFKIEKEDNRILELRAEVETGSVNTTKLVWNSLSNEKERYKYRLYKRKDEEKWSNCSVWDGKESVKVLNIYPTAAAKNYLKNWMEKTVSDTEEPAGKNLFDIDTVLLQTFNLNPDKYLLDENGNYKYDVLMFGTYDLNGGQDIAKEAVQATQSFIDAGGGVLFGHDTVGNNFAHRCPNFRVFAEQMGIKLIPDYDYSSCTKVKVMNEGFLTSYPWKLRGTLNIPATHSTSQYAGGTLDSTVWMEFMKKGLEDPETGAKNNAYLFSNNNLALIETGHSSGQATDDERKILANTLFYLKQLTEKTEAKEAVPDDTISPDKPEISGISKTKEGKVKLQLSTKDLGDLYQYYVEAVPIGKKNTSIVKSNVIKKECVSGIQGYIVELNEKAEKDISISYDDKGNITSKMVGKGKENFDYFLSDIEFGKTYYIHVCAVDNAGNISDETIQKITIEKEEDNESWKKIPYSLYAENDKCGISCCEASIKGNVYGKKEVQLQGSILNLWDEVSTSGMVAASGWKISIGNKKEQIPMPPLSNFSEEILNLTEGERDYPDYHSYCTNLVLTENILSENTISFNANTIEAGNPIPVVICAKEGDIRVQATNFKANGLLYAPNGMVSINVCQLDFTGSIVADEIQIQASYVNISK